MAGSGSENVPTELKCALCDGCVQNPKLLICQHSFCLRCLEADVGKFLRQDCDSFVTTCPICSVQTTIVGKTLADLPSNVLLQWMADRARAKQISNQQQQQQQNVLPNGCGHTTAENRQLCQHCNGRFCADCQVRHKELMKVDILAFCANYQERRAKIDDVKLERDLAALRQRLDGEIATIRAKLDMSIENAANALKRQADRCYDEAKQKSTAEMNNLTSLVQHANNDHNLSQLLADFKATSVLHMQLDEITTLYQVVSDCLKAVEVMEDPMTAVAELKLETPQPEFDLAMQYLENNRFLGVLLKTPKDTFLSKEPEIAAATAGEEEAEAIFRTYRKMEMIAAIAGNDCIGNEIRRPSLATTILDAKHGTAAICHNGNRITLMNAQGRLLCTYMLYDPDDLNTDVVFIDIAADANRVFVTDLSRRILALDLRFAPMPPGGAFIPGIFARSTAPDIGAGYRGLGVSVQRDELYTYEGSNLVGFSLVDATVCFSCEDPANWRRRVLAVRDTIPWSRNLTCETMKSPVAEIASGAINLLPVVVFSSDDGQTIVTRPIHHFAHGCITIAQSGLSVGKIRCIRPSGIAIDSHGNIFIADNMNERIQIFSNCLEHVECFVPCVASNLFDPWSLTCLQSSVTEIESEGDDETALMSVDPQQTSSSTTSAGNNRFADLKSTVLVVADCLPGRILLFAPKVDKRGTGCQRSDITTTTKRCEEVGSGINN